MAIKLKITENEKHSVAHEIQRETWKNVKMRNAQGWNWNMERKQKIMENKKYTRQDLDYGEETEKKWKMAHEHCTTSNMARNTEKSGKGEMYTV